LSNNFILLYWSLPRIRQQPFVLNIDKGRKVRTLTLI